MSLCEYSLFSLSSSQSSLPPLLSRLRLGEVEFPSQARPRICLWMCPSLKGREGKGEIGNGLIIPYLLYKASASTPYPCPVSSTLPTSSQTEVPQKCHSWSLHKLFPLPGTLFTSFLCLPKTCSSYTSGVMNLPLAGSFPWPLCESFFSFLFFFNTACVSLYHTVL